ncbi:hypothetical protein [Pontixanthobacter luteolus]|uniref:hypothetical protein n=1 Tax=Pontixanthobacter luteolus TaxID=295089 RepID=UPI0023041D6F|nr:hypothetical protein [Pontixanthobacter luteolus]
MKPGRFAEFIAVDWSGAKGERHKGIAVAAAKGQDAPRLVSPPGKYWSRQEVRSLIEGLASNDILIGMDLGISLPFADSDAFFPGWDRTPQDAKSLWAMVESICENDPNLEAGSFVAHPEASRYFRHSREHVGDRFHHPAAETREGRFRIAEQAQRALGVRPVSNFNLVGAAQVGKSSLTGMRMLHSLQGVVSVWPVDPVPPSGPVLVEMYTSIAARGGGARKGKTKLRSYEALNAALGKLGSPPVGGAGDIDDHSSDALVTAAWLRKIAHDPAYWNPAELTPKIARTEGWTFGAV